MAKKKIRDTISEAEFTLERKNSVDNPQEDSPGDSEEDTVNEFSFGIDFDPEDETSLDTENDVSVASTDSALERPDNLAVTPVDPAHRVPSSDMVKSSGR